MASNVAGPSVASSTVSSFADLQDVTGQLRHEERTALLDEIANGQERRRYGTAPSTGDPGQSQS